MVKRRFYSQEETAEQLNCSVKTVRRYIQQGRLKAIRLPGSRTGKTGAIRVSAKSIDELEAEVGTTV
ncbi:helix-turn-helix domain-containing protein [Actinomycetaceae bacterium TAE3-ERU4]|nr:helix-turn-helix domain-containing protein [Actinomycetaceae bacterium TAE3-ERU4]